MKKINYLICFLLIVSINLIFFLNAPKAEAANTASVAEIKIQLQIALLKISELELYVKSILAKLDNVTLTGTTVSSTAAKKTTKTSAFTCPAPLTAGEGCVLETIWAKDPKTGYCCKYDNDCATPVGWKVFDSESACGPVAKTTTSSTAQKTTTAATTCETKCKEKGYNTGSCKAECSSTEAEIAGTLAKCDSSKTCCCIE